MPSRLSSLLVRDGVVGVKVLERAFQRQVIYGGALDTNLLELRAATAIDLLRYTSLAAGVPPVEPSGLRDLGADAAAGCPEPAAREHDIVPVASQPDVLRVVVRDPVDLDRLEALATRLEVAVEPVVALEYQFHLARGRVFGAEVESRYSVLAARLAQGGEERAPTRARRESVVVGNRATSARTEVGDPQVDGDRDELAADARPADHIPGGESETDAWDEIESGAPEAPMSPHESTLPWPTPAARAPAGSDSAAIAEEAEAPADAAALDSRPAHAEDATAADASATGLHAEDATAADASATGLHAEDETAADASATGLRAEDETAADASATGLRAEDETAADARVAAADPEPDREDEGPTPPEFGETPLEPARAQAGLEAAAHRDDVFHYLLRAARSQAPYAALLTVQGGAAIGRVAIAEPAYRTDSIREAIIPLDVTSPFRQAVESGAPYIGPVATGDAELDPMVEELGGILPRAALILPISLRRRVVAVVVAHRGSAPIDISEVSGILPLAGAAADALRRLLTARRAAGKRGRAAAAPEALDDAPTTKMAAVRPPADESGESAAAAPEPAAESERDAGGDGAGAEELANPVEALLAAAARGDEAAAARARERALEGPEASLAAIATRFPGPLELDRHSLGSSLRPAPDHGPLLELLLEFGDAAAPLVTEELRSKEPAHRYYAALCAGAIQHESALEPLAERLFDADPGVRAAATEALASYPRDARERALAGVREVLAEIDDARVGAAADACAALAHAAAVPALIEALAHGAAPAAVHRALVALTKQDFGRSGRKWRSWWSRNRERSRVEWMIDALAHKDAELRRSAIEELRRVTGEYFGYHHDLPKRERSEAQRRWEQWWRETGQRHLSGLELERRSTALLPGHAARP